MTEPPSFDLNRALEYIETLQTPVPPLAIEEVEDSTLRIQPTIGPLAAGLIGLIVGSKRITRILEIGASLGCSACAMGRAARPHGGKVVTIEVNERIAAIARENIRAAGLEETVEILVADAKEAVRELRGPFGLILQDGSKDDYLPMLDRLVDLLEPGGILVTDDVLFPVMDLPASATGWKRSIAAYNLALKLRTDLWTVWLPIGDGVAVSVKG
jgi:predicted O-methyltransferase YrrM